ncbi:electron transport complex subunit E [Pokkaliibacter sp. MBI-7]|uniref:electron transport complex subunit E n=1 Tax=Pokkaliibacter sp. MBI-7 TaxID=3040600 RepID=UPI00244707B8|nr:electron transport complex subunit E [Pokkaliibacter sp. MBI-7]MDH2431524.1 electron transport complex subunit E [Pokkaliibacter sp. MBI-7]
MSDFKEITLQGLWKNNPALVQLLGLCPLLAVSASVVNALGLGLATMAVLTSSNLVVSLIRNQVTDAIRLPAFVMIIASLTTCVELLMQGFTYELYEILGIFIPLIVTNCVILGRADAFASKNGVLASAWDGFTMSLGFTLVLVLLGGIRELIGQGTLFNQMELLFGPMAAHWKIVVFHNYPGFLFAVLPPGAFVALGLLISLKNIIDRHLKERAAQAHSHTDTASTGSKRVRVTGHVE